MRIMKCCDRRLVAVVPTSLATRLPTDFASSIILLRRTYEGLRKTKLVRPPQRAAAYNDPLTSDAVSTRG